VVSPRDNRNSARGALTEALGVQNLVRRQQVCSRFATRFCWRLHAALVCVCLVSVLRFMWFLFSFACCFFSRASCWFEFQAQFVSYNLCVLLNANLKGCFSQQNVFGSVVFGPFVVLCSCVHFLSASFGSVPANLFHLTRRSTRPLRVSAITVTSRAAR
jgi:hypothetical protein